MQFAKQWWPVVASSIVLLIGVLLFVGDSVLFSGTDWSKPEPALYARTAIVALQLALSAAAIFGALRSDTHRFVLLVVTIMDCAIGLGFAIAGWIRIDEIVKNAALLN
jgi:hypothetical protein